MPFMKKAKNAAVHVETKRMSGECCGTACKGGMCFCHLIGGLLLLANLVVMILFFCQYTRTEVAKVGGRDNYKLVKQIYKTEAFQASQTSQIQQALQMYQGGAAQTQPAAQPSVQIDPSAAPTQ